MTDHNGELPPINGRLKPPLPSIIEGRGLGGGESTQPSPREATQRSRGESTQGMLIGEIVASTTTEFLAQALELDLAPPFGAFVEAATEDNLTVYAVVAHVETAGIDPGSRAIMRGHGDVRDARIYLENPDLPLVLRTTFRAVVVGFADSRIHQFLPPRPPKLHYSVYTCQAGTVRGFTASGLDYLAALLSAAEVPVDELLAANLRYTAAEHTEPRDFLQLAGRELAELLRADYPRLTAILRRCLAPSEVE